MNKEVKVPTPIFIEYYGTVVSCGAIRELDPEMRGLIEPWTTHQKIDNVEGLHELHYLGATQHSAEIIDLFIRFAKAGPHDDLTLVYVHRGHHRQCKTPLLQMLLAKLGSGFSVHALRVEQSHLPLEVLLFAMSTLGERGRCLIVKDNAIRLGKADVVSAGNIQYIVLSRSNGPWQVKSITLLDDALSLNRQPTYLEEFLSKDHRGGGSYSLVSRTNTNRLGIINITGS